VAAERRATEIEAINLACSSVAGGRIPIRCVANRSNDYDVAFSTDGEPISVHTVIRRCDRRMPYKRPLWLRESGKPMPLKARCAVNAAIAVALSRLGATG